MDKDNIYEEFFGKYLEISIKKDIDLSYRDIINMSYKNNEVKVKYVMEVDWKDIKPSRGGVIIYTIIEDKVYFGFGIDTQSGDITDFGGGIRYKKDNNAIKGALREFMEESLCSFGVIKEDKVKENVVIYSETIMILFLHLKVDINIINERFYKRVKNIQNPEISDIIWLTMNELKQLIKKGTIINEEIGYKKLYSRVRNLLKNAGNFYESL